MSLSILIPAKAFTQGKSRLSEALAPEERAALCRGMLAHVLAVATDAALNAAVHVVSACPEVRRFATEHGAIALVEQAAGHNAALTEAMQGLPPDRPLMILSADLPTLGVADLQALIGAQASADVVIATDRDGRGTNALLLARPGLIPLRFGPDSCEAYLREAKQARLRGQVVQRPGLADDIDLPEHLQIFSIGA